MNGKSRVTTTCFSGARSSNYVQLQRIFVFSHQEGRLVLQKCNLERRQQTFVTAVKDMVLCLVAKCVLLFSSAGTLIVSNSFFATSVLKNPVQLHNFNKNIVVLYAIM